VLVIRKHVNVTGPRGTKAKASADKIFSDVKFARTGCKQASAATARNEE
jgi:hypothetical protein